jgi:hypothetical protein
VRRIKVTSLIRRRRARARADAFSTRLVISSNRSNDQPRMAELGCLAMDGAMCPNSPADEEDAATTVLANAIAEMFG